jgi:DNA-binding MarR family transcriptional regulator
VAILEELAETAYMDKVGEDAYRVTEQGKTLVEGIFNAAHVSLGRVNFLADEEMAEIVALLQKLVKAVEAGAEPPAKWTLEHSRATDPGEDSSYASQIDQYLTDLYFFREGAHIAAWEPCGVAGYIWETLTFLWNEDEEANTGAALAERLQGRGYTAEDYAAALEVLAEKGWAEKTADGYQITEQGRKIRDEGEAETDRICFSSWDGLSNEEQAKLYTLLTRLKAKLVELAPEEEAQVA